MCLCVLRNMRTRMWSQRVRGKRKKEAYTNTFQPTNETDTQHKKIGYHVVA